MENTLERSSRKDTFLSPIWKANPLFVLLLGLCPSLAVTKSMESALGMGVLFIVILVGSCVLISLLRKAIPDEVHTPAYIIIIATFVTLVKMFTQAFLPELYDDLGVFISLLVVNCIILGRAEAFSCQNTVLDSLLDALGNGLGFSLALLMISFVREVFGTGVITIGSSLSFLPSVTIPILKWGDWNFSISLLQQPAGGFIVLAVILASIAAISAHKKAKIEEKQKALKEAMAHAKAEKEGELDKRTPIA